MSTRRNRAEAGWILIETVVLGIIVLAAAATLALFARTALLEERVAERMEAAFAARAQLSMMEAELDQGIPPLSGQRLARMIGSIRSRHLLCISMSSTMCICGFHGSIWGMRSRRTLCGG